MPQYLTPGVYVEEVDRGGKPIEGVATAVAAFVGFTEKGPREATQVTSWTQYRTLFGDFIEGAYLPTSVYGYFLNGGTRAYIMRVSPAITIPQSGSSRNSLEITPLLSNANDEPISVNVLAGDTPGRYKLTVQRGDSTETFSDLSSDKKDKSNKYVENIVNDPLKGSKLVRIYDASGNQSTPEARSPKPGSYSFIQPDGGGSKAAAELPPATIKMNSRGAGNAPTMELKAAPGVTSAITVEVADIAGQDELFKLIVKAMEGEESFDVSLKKGPQYVETVVNATRNGSKLVRAKDLATDSQLSPADRRPNAGSFSLPGVTAEAKAAGKAGVAVTGADFTGDPSTRTGVGALEALEEVTMVLMPDLMGLYQRGLIDMKGVQVAQTAMMNHCELMKNRVAILDTPPDMTPQQVHNWRLNEVNYDSKYAALYYPWVEIDNPMEKGKTMFSPPSGHMAGLWARIDAERGVHKAPANEILRGVIGLERNLTNAEQENLNPNGINVIRAFPGRGIRVWGARTLSSDPSWRYLNVRRLFNYIEASINRGTQWVVFEPNDQNLWERIKRDVTSFLNLVWMSGALFGATPDQAFFVKCDAETNPSDVIEAGMVITEIGISPVKPAEFVVFRIGQMVAGAE
jgi:phage tail sheath protein FI